MIELFLNKQYTILPADFTFEMEYENPYFTKSSTYSLDIDIPIRHIPQNVHIFGLINRLYAEKTNPILDAVVFVNGRIIFNGKATILSLTEDLVTVQLLNGNSYFNYKSEEVYIDDLNLGTFESICPAYFNPTHGSQTLNKSDYNCLFGSIDECDVVLHPACNGNPDNFSRKYFLYPNDVKYGPDCLFFEWSYRFSTQPYLLKVLKKIMEASGYNILRNDLNDSWLRNLYICNRYKGTVGTAFSQTKTKLIFEAKNALPHWKLNTFIDEIEKLCACVFVINDFDGVEIISLDKYYTSDNNLTIIPDEDIIDEYELEFEDITEDKDIASGNVEFDMSYSDKFLKVEPEVMDSIPTTKHYPDGASLLADFSSLSDTEKKKLRMINDANGREYIAYKADENSDYVLKEVNIFGILSRDGSENADVSLKIVPANTKIQNIGWWFSKGYSEPSAGLTVAVPYKDTETKEEAEPKSAQEVIENAYHTAKEESGDNIEVMISTGQNYHAADYQGHEYWYPIPFSDFEMNKSYKEEFPAMSLSLKDVCENSLGHLYRNIPSFHSNKKFVIQFLATSRHDPKNIFLIRNQRYVCKKISVTYDMISSRFLHEGEFYRID